MKFDAQEQMSFDASSLAWQRDDYSKLLALRKGKVQIGGEYVQLPPWPSDRFVHDPERVDFVIEVAKRKFVIVCKDATFWLENPSDVNLSGLSRPSATNVYQASPEAKGAYITWVVNGSAIAKIPAYAKIDNQTAETHLVFEATEAHTAGNWAPTFEDYREKNLPRIRHVNVEGADLRTVFLQYSATPVQARPSEVLKARSVDTIGLFANIDFPANARVTRYLGDKITNARAKELPASELTHAFSVAFGHDVLIGYDGSNEQAILEKSASLVNDLDMVPLDGKWTSRSKKYKNAKLVVESSDASPEEVPWLKTTRAVTAGEEFSIDYGNTWRARQNDAGPLLGSANTQASPSSYTKMVETEARVYTLTQEMQGLDIGNVRASANIPISLIERIDVLFEKPNREYAYFDTDGTEHPIASASTFFALTAAVVGYGDGTRFKARGPIVGRAETMRELTFEFYGQFKTASGLEIATRDFTRWDKNDFIYGD